MNWHQYPQICQIANCHFPPSYGPANHPLQTPSSPVGQVQFMEMWKLFWEIKCRPGSSSSRKSFVAFILNYLGVPNGWGFTAPGQLVSGKLSITENNTKSTFKYFKDWLSGNNCIVLWGKPHPSGTLVDNKHANAIPPWSDQMHFKTVSLVPLKHKHTCCHVYYYTHQRKWRNEDIHSIWCTCVPKLILLGFTG